LWWVHYLAYTERKCADTIGTLLVAWAGHFDFRMLKQMYAEAILSNGTRKLLWFEIIRKC